MDLEISVVIPTRNRESSLRRLLDSLLHQSAKISETLIVDSSDRPLYEAALTDRYPQLGIRCLTSRASVCVQRNLGIAAANSPFVFLCDDDIELASNYMSLLAEWMVSHPREGAVSGLFIEPGQDVNHQFPFGNTFDLFFRFVFQLPIHFDLDQLRPSLPARPLAALLRAFYRVRGNSTSFAGWPVVTNLRGPSFRTRVWGMAACLLRREWLGASPYDERLDPHGMGDNFEVSLNLPGAINVLTEAHAIHHRSPQNRLGPEQSYFKRILALHYFLHKMPRFSAVHRMWLAWSLFGNLFWQKYAGETERFNATRAALTLMANGRNPYLTAWKKGSNEPVIATYPKRQGVEI